MKKYLQIISFFAMSIIIVVVAGCSDSTSDPQDDTPFLVSQDNLNASTNVIHENLTGPVYGDATVAHNGMNIPSDATFRDVYASSANLSSLPKGTIVTKHTFLKDDMGNKSGLAVTFAMVKREAGYDSENGNWEYVMMPNDGSNDYNANPNGLLPEESNAAQRGKLAMCIGCHVKAGGNDFLFVNDAAEETFVANQADLNGSNKEFRMKITGSEFGDASIAHGGVNLGPNDTFRDVFSNLNGKNDPIKIGSIFTKTTFMKSGDERGDKLVNFAMVKRGDNYDPDNGNWEYSMIPFDAATDYNTYPNGILPRSENTEQRGKIAMCIGCHVKADGNDFLFTK